MTFRLEFANENEHQLQINIHASLFGRLNCFYGLDYSR